MCSQTHATIPMKHNGETIQIDRKLEILMDKIWSLGIGTNGSCEHDMMPVHFDGRKAPTAYIGFSTSKDIAAFLRSIGSEEELTTLGKKLANTREDGSGSVSLPNGWFVHWFDLDQRASYMLHFPPEQIASLAARFPKETTA
jgi:hypothetical protein